MELTKGANSALPAGEPVVVSCSWPVRPGLDADLSALQLTGGKVRSDEDFIFYNQPISPNGSVRHQGKSVQAGMVTDVVSAAVADGEAGVETIAFAISLDGPPGTALVDLGAITATVRAAGGFLATFTVPGLSTETALVAVEVYRLGAGWKVRAVGQGYQDGLGGLARDFGVDVGDTAAEPDQQPETEPAAGVDWRNPPVPTGYEL